MKIKITFSQFIFIMVILVAFIAILMTTLTSPTLLARGTNSSTTFEDESISLENQLASFPEEIISQSELSEPGSRPSILEIKKLNIKAKFEYVGITKNGDMGVPKNPQNVAWYKLGKVPGEIGSAVVAGHFGWLNGKPAIFDKLHLLKRGDEIMVENENGQQLKFVVKLIKSYMQGENPPEVFNSNDGLAHLNLVTCQGEWDKQNKSYPKRLVVFSDLVTNQSD